MKHLLLAFAAAAATTMSALPAAAQSTLSLKDAIAIAMDHNLTLANAAAEVEKADQDLAIARTKRLPTFNIQSQASQLLRPIDLTFQQGAFGEFAGIGPVPATDTSITTPARLNFVLNAQASQPLTQLHALNLNVKLNEVARAQERERLRDARLAVAGEIKRLYYAIAQSGAALEANLQTLTLLRELNRVVSTRVLQQVALKADSLNVEAKIADADLTRVKLRHALASQKEQLNQLLGRDLRTDFEVDAIPEQTIAEIDLTTAQAKAAAARPDVKQAQIKLQQAELAKRVARADRLPDVGIVVSFISPINIDGAPKQIATAALQAQWEPFDWGRKGRTIATRELQIRQARNSAKETEDRALLEINSRFRQLDEMRAQLRAVRLGQENARETARLRTTQYAVQAALLSDVLQAQASLADMDHQYQQALAAFWTARADFERALGEEVIQ
jgi:outer membrane protein